MQYHAILCIINNCWRSVSLPCGQYMAIFAIKAPGMVLGKQESILLSWQAPQSLVCDVVSYIREGSIIIWATLVGANTSLSHHYDHFEEQCSAGGIRSIRLQTIWVTISAIWHHTGHKGGLPLLGCTQTKRHSQSEILAQNWKMLYQIYGNFGGRKHTF